jgi:hypothetical protein
MTNEEVTIVETVLLFCAAAFLLMMGRFILLNTDKLQRQTLAKADDLRSQGENRQLSVFNRVIAYYLWFSVKNSAFSNKTLSRVFGVFLLAFGLLFLVLGTTGLFHIRGTS